MTLDPASLPSLGAILFAALFLLAGLALGLAFFQLLRYGLAMRLAGGRAMAPVLLVHALRWGGAVLAFWLAAQAGAAPLLAMLAGFLLARLAARRFAMPAGKLANRGGADGPC